MAKKALIFGLITAGSLAVTAFGVALGLIEMAKYTPAHADELLAHASDKQLPHAESNATTTNFTGTSRSVTGNPAGSDNLDDGTTRTQKSDHFDQQKNAQTQTLGDAGDNLSRNPALAVQQGVIPTGDKQ